MWLIVVCDLFVTDLNEKITTTKPRPTTVTIAPIHPYVAPPFTIGESNRHYYFIVFAYGCVESVAIRKLKYYVLSRTNDR